MAFGAITMVPAVAGDTDIICSPRHAVFARQDFSNAADMVAVIVGGKEMGELGDAALHQIGEGDALAAAERAAIDEDMVPTGGGQECGIALANVEGGNAQGLPHGRWQCLQVSL
jgi:hypothetical protein